MLGIDFLFLCTLVILHSRHFMSFGAMSPHDESWMNGSIVLRSFGTGVLFSGLFASAADKFSAMGVRSGQQ